MAGAPHRLWFWENSLWITDLFSREIRQLDYQGQKIQSWQSKQSSIEICVWQDRLLFVQEGGIEALNSSRDSLFELLSTSRKIQDVLSMNNHLYLLYQNGDLEYWEHPDSSRQLLENHPLSGQSLIVNHGGIQTEELKTDDAVLMKCGNFVNSWLSNEQQPNEALAIHFYPDVIELIFENQVPHYLLKGGNPDAPLIQKIEQSKILKSYVDGLLLYFENPQLFTRETAIIKLRELIGLLYNLDSHGSIYKFPSAIFRP